MKCLAISKEIQPVDWSALRIILADEARILHNLFLDGQIREFYFTDEDEAVLILECTSKDAARELLQQLPLVQQGLIKFEVMELKPYSGFSRLF